MRTRALGRSGLRLTEVGFGGAVLGNLYAPMSDEQATSAVECAWDRGIRYFDTAPHYGLGLSERRLGRALARYPRSDFVVSTKVGRLIEPNPNPRELDDDGFVVPGDKRRVWDFTADGVRRSLDDSLTRMGLDSIDIAFAHDPDQFREGAAMQGLEALAELRAQNVIRAIGVGTNNPQVIPEIFEAGLLDVVMVAGRYSLLDQSGWTSAICPAQQAGIGVVVAGVFNSGLLSSPTPKPGARFDYRPTTPQTLDRARRLAEACRERGTTLPAAAIAFPLLTEKVACVALGMRDCVQVNTNLDWYEEGVPPSLWQDLVDTEWLDAEFVPQ